MFALSLSYTTIVTGGFVFLLGYSVLKIIYRYFFHPLRVFPGPWIAQISYLFEVYYDIWLPGQFTYKLKQLHEQYGPVVRINPDELHFNDPDYYDEIYNARNAPIEKPYKEANIFGPYPSTMGTVDHDLHRIRRRALNPFFSRRSVLELIPCLQPIIENLCQRFEDAARAGEQVNLKYAYNALAMDNMSEYCFSKGADRVLLSDYDRKTFDNIDDYCFVSLLNEHLPWLLAPLYRVPDWLNRRLAPIMADIADLREALSEQVEDIRHGRDASHEKSSHRTIFHDLLDDSSGLSSAERSKARLRDEAFILVAAGTHTVSHTLKAISYHIMANPDIHKRLVEDLKTLMPDRLDVPNLADLEKLPYLTAVISEGLRLTHPVTHRLHRAFPEKALQYNGQTVPPGTIVSMTSLLIHENENIFPEPTKFMPDRWLTTPETQNQLSRYLTTFSRGTRGCVGINLAWAEMYLVLAIVFRRFEFDFSEVLRGRDIDCTRDTILGVQDSSSPGVLVRLRTVV